MTAWIRTDTALWGFPTPGAVMGGNRLYVSDVLQPYYGIDRSVFVGRVDAGKTIFCTRYRYEYITVPSMNKKIITSCEPCENRRSVC